MIPTLLGTLARTVAVRTPTSLVAVMVVATSLVAATLMAMNRLNRTIILDITPAVSGRTPTRATRAVCIIATVAV